jgi:hypothetical protein
MRFEKFNTELKKINEDIGTFQPFVGSTDRLILAENLFERSSVEMLLEELSEGTSFKTAHLASREQLEELGIELSCKSSLFVFDTPTNFTIPVIIPS